MPGAGDRRSAALDPDAFEDALDGSVRLFTSQSRDPERMRGMHDTLRVLSGEVTPAALGVPSALQSRVCCSSDVPFAVNLDGRAFKADSFELRPGPREFDGLADSILVHLRSLDGTLAFSFLFTQLSTVSENLEDLLVQMARADLEATVSGSGEG